MVTRHHTNTGGISKALSKAIYKPIQALSRPVVISTIFLKYIYGERSKLTVPYQHNSTRQRQSKAENV